jgi:tRNA pseudouridine38-40 synthase
MSINLKLTLEYDGTHFNGWQIQPKGQRTVQGEIKKALQTIFKKDLTVIGSGRTDSGVHALGQVANVKIPKAMPVEELHRALNALLPSDIAVIDVKKVSDTFHAQYSAKQKTYRYTISHLKIRSPLHDRFALHYPYPLNVALMKKEAKSLVGRHDFRSFQAAGSSLKKKASTIRTIKSLKIHQRGFLIFIDITADGFLYKMVRNIVGSLLVVGAGRLKRKSLKTILSQKDRKLAPPTAKAQGLCLVSVNY